nr:MAG: RNA-dependent RNA polymerase [Wufeng shrew nodavirus 1]
MFVTLCLEPLNVAIATLCLCGLLYCTWRYCDDYYSSIYGLPPRDYRHKVYQWKRRNVDHLGHGCDLTGMHFSKSEFGFIRTAFRRITVPDLSTLRTQLDSNHPHTVLATFRQSAHRQLMDMVERCGMDVYELSHSRRSSARGYHGIYTIRDLDYDQTNDPIKNTDVLVGVDVDYYLDIHMWARNMQPILLYTFAPVTPTGVTAECEWVVDSGNAEFTVRGGGIYKHALWNFGGDSVIFKYKDWYYCYLLDVKRYSDTHQIVCLTPMAVYWGIKPNDRVMSRLQANLVVSASRVVGYVHGITIDIPRDTYNAIKIRLAVSSKPCIADIEAVLRMCKVSQQYEQAAALYSLFQSGGLITPSVGYTFYVSQDRLLLDHTPKPSCIAACPAVLDLGNSPDKNVSNAAYAEIARHRDIINVVIPPPIYDKWANEFVFLTVDSTATPVSISEVMESQTSSNQKLRHVKFKDEPLPSKTIVSAFMKSESYVGEKAPRNISNVNPRVNLELARYTQGIKPLLKTHHWYAPGCTPAQIELAVHRVCNTMNVVETDYSKFDGTISSWLRRSVEFKIFERAYLGYADSEVLDLLNREIDASAYTSAGKYDVVGSRLSGSSVTTEGNTLINAFVAYCANRLTGKGRKRAFDELGLYFGDDGISSAIKVGERYALEIAAEQLGLSLKCKPIFNDVTFLGRVYPHIRLSHENMQDPIRVLSKVNLCVNSNFGKDILLQRKIKGLLVTDSQTPLIGNILRCLLRLYCHELGDDDILYPYLVDSNNSWTQVSGETSNYAIKYICSVLCLSQDLFNRLDKQFCDCVTTDMMPAIPITRDYTTNGRCWRTSVNPITLSKLEPSTKLSKNGSKEDSKYHRYSPSPPKFAEAQCVG